jgi:hypothetical protein
MRIAWILAVSALAIVLLAGSAARAQDPYTVSDINVDLTRETSAIARQDAIEQAHVQAFEHLLQRLTPAADRSRLPKVTFALAANHAAGLRIDDEKSSATRYAAKMTISFRQDRVRELIRDSGASYAETPAPAVVVAPLYHWAGAQALWEQNNPWRAAWSYRGAAQGLAPVLLPKGDLADSGALSAAQVANRDRVRLGAYAARYGAAGVLVAEASYGIDPVSGRPTFDVVAEVVGQGPNIGRFRHVETGAAGAKPEALGVLAANAVVAALEAAWKRESAGPGAAGLSSLVADLPISGLRDFANARRRLDASPGVTKHELVALSRERARFRLYYTGSPESVRAGIARQSMDLVPAGAGSEAQWVLVAPPSAGGR